MARRLTAILLLLLLPAIAPADGLDTGTAGALSACLADPAGLRACTGGLLDECAQTRRLSSCQYDLGLGLLDLTHPRRTDAEVDALAAGIAALSGRLCSRLADAEPDPAARIAAQAACLFESRLQLMELLTLND